MTDYTFQSSTSGLKSTPVFRMAFDTRDAQQFQNVLGFAIESVGRSPLSEEELESIAKNAVQVAKELLFNNVYLSDSTTYKTERLYESIKYRKNSKSITIYSDARDSRTGYPYAGSIEYGFHPWGHSKYVPPRPFLRPAIQFAANATRASLEENVKQMLLNYRNNNFALSHFSQSSIVGTSHRYWGVNVGNRFDGSTLVNIDTALRSSQYSEFRNSQRYGTERGQYHTVWKIDR